MMNPLLAAFSALALSLPVFAAFTVDGTVDDVFPDELDPSVMFLLLKTDAKRYYCTLQTNVFRSLDAESLIGADVRVTGSLLSRRSGPRRHMDRSIFNRELGIIQTKLGKRSVQGMERETKKPLQVDA